MKMKQRSINYQIFHHGNEVIAVSTFAKKPVKGVAKCSPNDNYDHRKGESLAIARCDVKVAEKRMKRANEKVDFYTSVLEELTKELVNAKFYQEMSKRELDAAKVNLRELEETM